MKYKVSDVTLKVPSKEVAIKVFRGALGLEPISPTTPLPMIYILDEFTDIILDFPEVNPTYSTHLHLSTTPKEFDEVTKRLEGIEGIEVIKKTHQAMSGKERRTVRVNFKNSDTVVLINDILSEEA